MLSAETILVILLVTQLLASQLRERESTRITSSGMKNLSGKGLKKQFIPQQNRKKDGHNEFSFLLDTAEEVKGSDDTNVSKKHSIRSRNESKLSSLITTTDIQVLQNFVKKLKSSILLPRDKDEKSHNITSKLHSDSLDVNKNRSLRSPIAVSEEAYSNSNQSKISHNVSTIRPMYEEKSSFLSWNGKHLRDMSKSDVDALLAVATEWKRLHNEGNGKAKNKRIKNNSSYSFSMRYNETKSHSLSKPSNVTKKSHKSPSESFNSTMHQANHDMPPRYEDRLFKEKVIRAIMNTTQELRKYIEIEKQLEDSKRNHSIFENDDESFHIMNVIHNLNVSNIFLKMPMNSINGNEQNSTSRNSSFSFDGQNDKPQNESAAKVYMVKHIKDSKNKLETVQYRTEHKNINSPKSVDKALITAKPNNKRLMQQKEDLSKQEKKLNKEQLYRTQQKSDNEGFKQHRNEMDEKVSENYTRTQLLQKNIDVDNLEGDISKQKSKSGEEEYTKKNITIIRKLVASLAEDPFETWIYHQKSFDELGITPSLLKAGIVNLGSSWPMQRAVRKSVKGKNVKVLVVGGSISAGGGLWKERGNIDGVYHKAFADWWRGSVTPVTNSQIEVSNAAIGGTDSEYFSYCIDNFIKSDPDIVLWELSANDYNRFNERDYDPGKPLEQLTRILLQLPSHPAMIYINFFRPDRQNFDISDKCPDSEETEVDVLSRYYDIPSLSWRRMVCDLITKRTFVSRELFGDDGLHPNLLGHAQVAMLLMMYVKGVFETVLSEDLESTKASDVRENQDLDFDRNDIHLKIPAFKDPLKPEPRCWTLLTPDKDQLYKNTLENVNVLKGEGFELRNVTTWEVRTDRIQCLLAARPNAILNLSVDVPVLDDDRELPLADAQTRTLAVAIHNKFGGAAEIQLDELPSKSTVHTLGTERLKQSRVYVVSEDVRPGVHNLNFRSLSAGFCLTSIMVI